MSKLIPTPIKTKCLKARGGFALVITLSLMAFILLLLVTIGSLAQVETRSANTSLRQLEAQQAALLGLNIAIGELQKTAGPDQRVTANAGIFGTTIKQPHLLGVWKSYKQANSDTGVIDYDSKTKNEDDGGDFVQWLSSASVTEQNTLAYAGQAPNPNNSFKLVDHGSVSNPADHIEVPLVDIESNGDVQKGKYAWQVFDESQKANVSLENGNSEDDFSKIQALGGAGRLGYEHVDNFKDLDILDEATSAKLVSNNSLELGVSGFDLAATSAFYTLTNLSKGLLVDVTQGKFQTDLSLLFAGDALPAAYSGRHLYSDSQTPIASNPERFGGDDNINNFVQPLPNPDPTWDLLHSHYRLYRDVEEKGGEYYMPLGNSLTNDPDSGVTPIYDYGSSFDPVNNPEKLPNEGFENHQQILPVVSNAQFIYSLINSYQADKDRCNVSLVTDVVVTLWNPYNVNMEVDNMELEFYRFPVSFAFYRRVALGGLGTLDELSPGDYFHVSNMHHPRNIAGVGQNANWSLRDSVPYRVRITGTTLAPGEFRVFGVTKYNENCHPGSRPIMNHEATYLTHGMVLENGFDETQGGVQTNSIMWRDDKTPGEEHGWFYSALNDMATVAAKSRMVTNGFGGFKDLNGEEAGAFIKIYMGDGGDLAPLSGDSFEPALNELYANGDRAPIGSIVLNSSNLNVVMPDIDVMDTPEHTLGNYTGWEQPLQNKTPMVIASLRLKTEQSSNDIGSRPNARKWLNNGITNPYASNGLAGDQNLAEQNLQYELTWEPMTDWVSIPAVEVDDGRGFGGSGVDSETGVQQAIVSQLPLAPATSIAQFTHAPLNKSGLAPLTSQIVGNSFASPVIERDKKIKAYDALNTHYLDHSYLANSTLFDGYFLSTAVSEANQAVAVSKPRSLTTTLTEFFSGVRPLQNPQYETTVSENPGITADSYDEFANYLYNKGAFNVNSTSVEAWALFLASGSQAALPILNALTAGTGLESSEQSEDDLVAFPRFSPMLGDKYTDPEKANDPKRWEGGVRRLNSAEIMTLATNIVSEVKSRGPFQSVSEFINRRLTKNALGDHGALQAAINASDLNANHAWNVSAPVNDTELGGTGTGFTSDGAPDQLTQADLLNRLAPSLCVRGDTFKIRAYGEVQDSFGSKSVSVCEAVVQRTHDYVDPEDASNVAYRALTPSSTNKTFGRKFKIVSLRWLPGEEI